MRCILCVAVWSQLKKVDSSPYLWKHWMVNNVKFLLWFRVFMNYSDSAYLSVSIIYNLILACFYIYYPRYRRLGGTISVYFILMYILLLSYQTSDIIHGVSHFPNKAYLHVKEHNQNLYAHLLPVLPSVPIPEHHPKYRVGHVNVTKDGWIVNFPAPMPQSLNDRPLALFFDSMPEEWSWVEVAQIIHPHIGIIYGKTPYTSHHNIYMSHSSSSLLFHTDTKISAGDHIHIQFASRNYTQILSHKSWAVQSLRWRIYICLLWVVLLVLFKCNKTN